MHTGERWVLLGPNGCGKTTLLNALTGYMTPVDGTMELLGQTYGETDWRDLRASVGLVSTSLLPRVEPGEKAWEVVMSGRYAQINFWGNAAPEDRERAEEGLRRVEAGHLSESPWGHLSAGERQRVLIARALNADPAVLFLDEPCAHLDPVARERFLGFVDRLRDVPTVLVTHHVEEIVPSTTHALLMSGGRVAAAGPLEEVLTSANLGRVFGAPVDLRRTEGRWTLKVAETP